LPGEALAETGPPQRQPALRNNFGIEAAGILLGHRSITITEAYADEDQGKADAAIRQTGLRRSFDLRRLHSTPLGL